MKKILIFLLLSSIFVFANIGKITAVKGNVFVERTTGKEIPKSGFILKLNDKIVTEGKSKALVLFNDKTSITVGKDSVLSVNEFVMDETKPANSKANFGFGKGVFRTITGKIGKINPKGFKIKTKSASIGIRGTTLDTSVKQLPDGTEKVDVAFLKGSGFIQSDATGQTFNVATNQKASMSAGGEADVQTGALEESGEMDQDSNELESEAKAQGQETATEEDDQQGEEQTNEEENQDEEQQQEENQDEEQTNEEDQQNNEEDQQQDENQNNEEEQQENQDTQQEEETTQESEEQQQDENSEDQSAGEDQQSDQNQEDQATDDNQQQEDTSNEDVSSEDQGTQSTENEQTNDQNTENTAGEETTQTQEQDTTDTDQTADTAPQQEQDVAADDTPVQNNQDTGSNNEVNTDQTDTTVVTDDPIVEETQPQVESQTDINPQTTDPNTLATDAPEVDTAIPQTDTPDLDTDVPETDVPDIDTEIPETDIPDIDLDIPDTSDLLDSVNDATGAADDASDSANDAVVNDPPVVSSGIITAKEDEVSTFNVSATDTETLTYSIVEQPSNGTAEINPQTGQVTYTPNDNYNGEESMVISISDGTNNITENINFNVSPVNDTPTIDLSSTSITTDEDTSSTINYNVEDVEDGIGLTPTYTANHGTVTFEDGVLTYSPESEYSGEDTITVIYEDQDGAIITDTIDVIVNDVNNNIVTVSPSGETDSITNDISTVTKEIVGSDTYYEYGYFLDTDNITKTSAYVTGELTPSAVIQQYIDNAQTASYSGGIAAFVDGVASGGSINLNMDFGNKNFTGDISVTQGNWNATINSGNVHTYGYSSTAISGSSTSGSITSGSIDGKFYGPSAQGTGGNFSLDSSSSSVNGTFGASKK